MLNIFSWKVFTYTLICKAQKKSSKERQVEVRQRIQKTFIINVARWWVLLCFGFLCCFCFRSWWYLVLVTCCFEELWNISYVRRGALCSQQLAVILLIAATFWRRQTCSIYLMLRLFLEWVFLNLIHSVTFQLRVNLHSRRWYISPWFIAVVGFNN